MTNKIIRIDDLQKGFRDTFLKNYSPEELNKKLEESFYGILANDDTLYNPLSPLPFGVSTPEYFPKYMIYLMNRPEYFYLIIKTLFGMESFPIQGLTLRELYLHRFPILLGSRGYSKCLIGNSLVITNKGIKEIGDLVSDHNDNSVNKYDGSLLGENKYTKINFSFCNGEKATKIIKTKSGRTIEATLNHPLRVVSNGEIVWKNAEDIKVGDYMPVVRGVKEWEYEELDKDVAYMVGAMVGDGCYTDVSDALRFTNIDQECLDNVNKGLKKWNKSNLKLINLKSGKRVQYRVTGGISTKRKFVKDFRTNAYSKQIGKLTPKKIFSASFEAIAAYLQGLFDTDGCCATGTPVVEFSTKTKRLAEETQFLLMCLGINSNLKTQRNKKYNKDYYKLQISGSSLRVFRDKVGFRVTRKQDILKKHCLQPTNENLDIVPHELILDKLLKLRELARDTTYSKGHGYDYDRQSISPHKIRSYQPSYNTLNKMLDLFSKSKAASESKEFADLCGIAQLAHYYDEVTEITDGFCKTYDVELVEDHSFISNGFISHNTTLLGMYLLIKMLLTPGIKCVITGAGFRQAKLLFNVMESIWDKAPILQSCFKGKSQGPSHGTDVWTFRMGDSITYALPVGPDGSKVRGYRANLLVCVDRDTLVQTDSGLVKIVDYMREDCMEVMNSLGEFERPKNFVKTDKIDVYEVKAQNGYSIKCSEYHKLLVTDGKNTKWKLAKDLTSDDFLELDNNDYFPKKPKVVDGRQITSDIGFLIGVLISEGTVTNRNYISITNTNKDLIDDVKSRNLGIDWSESYRDPIVDHRGWKCKGLYQIKYNSTEFRKFLKNCGIDYVDSLEKEIPSAILQSPREVVIEFLKGLFLGDGSCFSYNSKGKTHVGVAYYSSSKTLIDQLQILLLKFGITSAVNPRYTKISGNVNYLLSLRGQSAHKIYELLKNKYWDTKIPNGFKFEYSTRTRKKGNKYIASLNRCDKNIYIGSYDTEELAEQAIISARESYRPTVRVKSVVKLDKQDHLYDFTMAEDHSFCAGGFINHNCDEFSCTRNSIISTDLGLLRVEDIVNNKIKCNVYNYHGELEPIIGYVKTPKTQVYRLKTEHGYEIDFSKNHKFMLENEQWKLGVELDENDRIRCDSRHLGDTILGTTSSVKVKSVELLDEEDHLYDIALPTTHSYYANGLVNHNTIQRHVFEEVMSGFLSVSSSVIEQVKTSAKNLAIDRLKIPVAFDEGDEYTLHNQLVLSGTAYYKHNHFYEYFKKWRDIISSGGNEKKLKEIFGEDQDVSRVNYRNYSILRVPIELIPEGQMDMEQIDRIKASSSKSVYMREYACCFTNDSDGFYKKSLIDSCTVGSSWLPVKKDGKEINFGASLIGDKNCKYVYGVDPAYQGDNFAIVILEIHENHRRVVYCWTTQANEHKQLLKDEIIKEHNYYEYCSRKIRNLMKTFPCAYIALDPLGGGKNILECLMDPTKLRPGEVRILPTIDRNSKPKETDLMEGEHIIEIASNSPTWIAEANYAMKKDMETRDLLFPSCDDTTYVIADFYDSEMSKVSELYDTLEDCVTEIEELKKELTIITVSETATGKEHFDTYEVKGGATTKKTRLKKDRYSALLMANWYARTNEFFVTRALGPDLITMSGFESSSCPGALYGGNNELAKRLQSLYE